MTTVARVLYTQEWKDSTLPTMNEQMVKMMELAQMTKMIALIKDRSFLSLMMTEKPYCLFAGNRKNKVMIHSFDDWKKNNRLQKNVNSAVDITVRVNLYLHL